MKSSTKIVFAGTPEVAAETLATLLDSCITISAVVTMPDAEIGRGRILTPSPVANLAKANNIQTYKPKSKAELLSILQEEKPDLVVMIAFGMIITKEALAVPRLGFLNVHYSLLPAYRGASPYVAAILNGDPKTGVTIQKTGIGLDDGDIVAKAEIALTGTETSQTLLATLTDIGAKLLVKTLPGYINGEINPKAQVGEPTFAGKISKSDGQIDWSKSAAEIERMTRAYHPWPGTFTYLNDKVLKISSVKILEENIPSGQIKVVGKDLIVGTCNGALQILALQPEGKRSMTAHDFLNSNTDLSGKTLG